MADVTPEEDAILRAALRASGKVVETAATRAAVAAARAEIVAWLRDMAHDRHSGFNWAADQIERGDVQRWAAERAGQGDG